MTRCMRNAYAFSMFAHATCAGDNPIPSSTHPLLNPILIYLVLHPSPPQPIPHVCRSLDTIRMPVTRKSYYGNQKIRPNGRAGENPSPPQPHPLLNLSPCPILIYLVLSCPQPHPLLNPSPPQSYLNPSPPQSYLVLS